MNKIFISIFIVIALSSCTSAKEMYIKTMKQKDAAKERCMASNSTMMGYVKCIHIFKKKRGYELLENTALTVQMHTDYEGLRNLEEKYWMVIAKEVDEGHMPPEKFLAKYPDKNPSKKDKKAVVKWAKAAAKEL